MSGSKIIKRFNEYTSTFGMFSALGDLYDQIINTSSLVNYTTTAGINTKLGPYATTDEVVGTINSELGSYANTTDLNERLSALEQRLAALESGGGGTIESIMTSEPILTQVDNTYTIEAVGDNLGSEGWYYSINGTAFNFTTKAVLTRPFTSDENLTVIVQGTSGAEYTSTLDLVYQIESIMTSEPILTQVNNTYTIEAVGDNLGSEGWYYSINGTAFNFTTDALLTRPFEQDETTVTVIVDGTSGAEYTSTLDLVYIEPAYFMRLVSTAGDLWFPNYDYYYFSTTPEGRYLYGLVETGTENRLSNTDEWDIEYNPDNNMFYNIGSSSPSLWDTDANGNGTSAFPTAANMQTHYLYDLNDNFMIQFDNPYYVAPPPEPGYKYLGFAGQAGSTHGWLNEIALTLTDGTKIDKNNQIPINMITLVANIRPGLPEGVGNNINGVFDGQLSNTPQNALMFEAQESGILLYMEAPNKKQVESGVYFTQGNNISYQIDAGRLYGTNTDPTTFTDAQNDANWNYICELTKAPITVQSPYYSYATVIAKEHPTQRLI